MESDGNFPGQKEKKQKVQSKRGDRVARLSGLAAGLPSGGVGGSPALGSWREAPRLPAPTPRSLTPSPGWSMRRLGEPGSAMAVPVQAGLRGFPGSQQVLSPIGGCSPLPSVMLLCPFPVTSSSHEKDVSGVSWAWHFRVTPSCVEGRAVSQGDLRAHSPLVPLLDEAHVPARGVPALVSAPPGLKLPCQLGDLCRAFGTHEPICEMGH